MTGDLKFCLVVFFFISCVEHPRLLTVPEKYVSDCFFCSRVDLVFCGCKVLLSVGLSNLRDQILQMSPSNTLPCQWLQFC